MRFTIAGKGLILVAVPLMLELIFVGVLLLRLKETDSQIDQELKNKAIVEQTTILLRQLGSTSSAIFLGSFASGKPVLDAETDRQVVTDSFEKLDRLVGEDKALQPASQRLKSTIDRFFSTVNQLSRIPKSDLLTGFSSKSDTYANLSEEFRIMDRSVIIFRLAATNYDLEGKQPSQMRTVLLSGVLLNLAVTVILALGFARDISGRLKKLAENTRRVSRNTPPLPLLGGHDELNSLDLVIHRMSDQLQDADRQRRQLTSMVRNRLQEPLSEAAGILSSLENARQDSLPAAALSWIKKLSRQLDRLIGLLNDLSEIPQIESDQIELSRQKLSSAELVQKSLDSVQSLAVHRELQLISTGPNLEFSGDGDRITQVLINLLTNAIKFSPLKATISVQVADLKDEIAFRVKDSGPGIPRELQDKIFGRFEQSNREDATARGGAGLGLNICAQIARLHAGKLLLESEPGKGSEFSLQIPRQAPDKAAPPTPQQRSIWDVQKLSTAAVKNALTPKIWHKGMIVVAVPLVFQISFLVLLNSMLEKAHEEGLREMQARQTSAVANRMFRDSLRMCTSAGSLHLCGETRHEKLAYAEELLEILKDFCDSYELADQDRTAATRISAILSQCERIMLDTGKMILDPAPGANLESLSLLRKRVVSLQKDTEKLAAKITNLMEAQQMIERQSSALRAETRNAIEMLILCALALSILLSLALAAFFSKSISKKVAALIENTLIFTQGKEEFLPPLSGRDELKSFDADFRLMVEKLKQAEEFKRHIFAVVSHELRTPLTSISGSLFMLQQGVYGALSQDSAELLQRAYQDIMQVVQLVNDLLDIERLEAGKFPLEIKCIDLGQAVETALSKVRESAPDACLILSSKISHPLVNADVDLLVKALSKLLLFVLEGECAPEPLTIELQEEDGFFSTAVPDRLNHLGLDGGAQIFEKFQFLERSEIHDFKGSALALALSKTIVTRMEGEISAHPPAENSSGFIKVRFAKAS